MIVSELTPIPGHKFRFNFESFKLIPKHAGCYVISSHDNMILYIGLAVNLNSRFMQHLNNPEKTSPTTEGKPIWFYYLEYDQNNLNVLERSWMNQYSARYGRRPILNKKDSPIS